MVWRLIHAGMATRAEVDAVNGWSLIELADACDVLDTFALANHNANKVD